MAGERFSPKDMLTQLVAFDTISSKSNMALIEWARDYLAGHGVESRVVPNDEGTKANLFATLGPTRDGGVVLSGHTDVVPVDGQDWSTDPFALAERDGAYYGRGAADMKGFIAIVLALVPDFLAAGLETPIHLALSYDEEVGCLGVPDLIALLADELPKPRLAIIGEPTSMRVVNAHKGIVAFRTSLTGLEAHSSAPQRAVNAIFHAAEIIGFIAGLAEELRKQGPDAAFTPPYTTFNIGRIGGGTAINIVPKDCWFEWEFRPLPNADPDDIVARLDAFVAETVLPRMRAVHPQADVRTEILARAPPLLPAGESPAQDLAMRLTGANRTDTVAYTSEAGLFQEAGIPAILCGPGDIAQAHQPDEFITAEQLAAGDSFLRRLIDWATEGAPERED